MSPSDRDSQSGEPSGSLERAAAILDAFDFAHRELGLAELVRRSGLPRSTVHRTAGRMIELGWLDKPGDRYRISTGLFKLSSLVPVRHELREAVLPFLQDLYAAARVTVQLGVLDGTRVLVVDKITGHRPMPMLDQVGGVIPAHCSGLGRAMLAFSEPSTVDAVIAARLERRTPRTITSPTTLRRELAAIPDRGWAYDREEGIVGISCIAAPIFSAGGGVAVRMAASAATRAYSTRRWESH
jgi:DNA-binding IclR family transcriptional regulator